MVLDVERAVAQNGSAVIQWGRSGGGAANQLWQARRNADGTFSFFSKLNLAMALDITGAQDANGVGVEIWQSNGGPNQRFYLIPLDYSTVPESDNNIDAMERMIAPSGNQSLRFDIEGASTVDGARVILWPNNGGSNQLFKIEPLRSGYHAIRSSLSGKLVYANGATYGAPIKQVWPYVADVPVNCQWSIRKSAGGNYTIVNRLSGLSFDTETGGLTQHAKLVLASPASTPSKTFKLI